MVKAEFEARAVRVSATITLITLRAPLPLEGTSTPQCPTGRVNIPTVIMIIPHFIFLRKSSQVAHVPIFQGASPN